MVIALPFDHRKRNTNTSSQLVNIFQRHLGPTVLHALRGMDQPILFIFKHIISKMALVCDVELIQKFCMAVFPMTYRYSLQYIRYTI